MHYILSSFCVSFKHIQNILKILRIQIFANLCIDLFYQLAYPAVPFFCLKPHYQ